MKSMLKGLLVAVCAATGFASFGALKVTQEHYNWQNTAAHTNYYGNLVSGFVPTSVNPHEKNREAMLVDGISAFGKEQSGKQTFDWTKFFVYNGTADSSKATTLEWNFLDQYVKGVDISSMTLFGCWETDASVRANVNIAKIEYATVDAPDTLVALEGSAVNCGGSIYNILTYADDTAKFMLQDVARLKITFTATTYAYDGIDEIEIFGEEVGDYAVSSAQTQSRLFVSSSPVSVTGFPLVDGMTQYCLRESPELPDAQTGWKNLAEGVPTEQSFTVGSKAKDFRLYAFLRANESAPSEDWVLLQSSVIRYTTATPTLVASQDPLARGFVTGESVTINGFEFDQGSQGGTDPGDADAGIAAFNVPIEKFKLSVISGPGEDIDESETAVTLNKPGDYTLQLTVVNVGGAEQSGEVAVTVTENNPDVVRTWTGSVNADWMEAGNWTPTDVPAAGRNLCIPAGCTRYPELKGGIAYPASGEYKSVTVEQGAKIVFLGDTAKNCGPTLKASNLTVEGALDADGKGFANNSGTGYVGAEGAAHGGLGKFENRFYQLVAGNSGVPYGNVKEPVMLGSGCDGQPGGGAIRLVVSRTLTVDGVVSANALTGARSSGGSVWISCGTFAGSGKVSANASAGGHSSRGGGGGRVAIHAGTKTFAGTVEVSPTLTGCSASTGTPGTLYEPGRYPVGTAEEPATITLDGDKFIYVFPDDDQVRYWNLDVKGSANVGFADGKLHLGTVTVAGTSKLALGRWGEQVIEGDCKILSEPAITLGNGCHLMLPGAETQRELTVSALTVPSGAYLYFGSADLKNLWGSRLRVKGDLAVAGTISVVGTGSTRGRGGKFFDIDGGSPHGGTVYRSSTAGYYGSLAKPVTIGSVDSSKGETIGGGAIELCVDGTMTLDGTVTAQGIGRGAGGSVWVKAQKLSGSGTINASCDSSSERPGAGGRIAIEAADNSFAGAMKVDGSNTNTQQAYCGTISVVNGGWADDFGVDYSIGGCTKDLFTFSATADVQGEALVMTRTFSKCKPCSYAWTEKMSLKKHETTAVNTATYTVAGLKPNALVEVTHNGVAVLNDGKWLRADAEGKVSFSAELTEANGDTFSVRKAVGIALIVR